ncbi:MAS2 Mitochondrial-processing peptidase subunit alpha [Candida maltosa Xu316]|uniref:Mitochondrial-processing peptidase (MPP) alpha subunit, mitochondrial, putative n=1 Tax=Candida maltosa (strain Xu316) TaxID=1245528 RepID=M3JU02_CANMX|nr:Mitochondrial-processing peptidase (MPP) alpha subunit, mitochondrial, putative [Candida maltosa Xu316]
MLSRIPRTSRHALSAFHKARRYTTAVNQTPLELTTLPNGLRLITDSTPGHFSALGAFVDAGSRYDDPQNPGLSHIHDKLAWKSTEKYTGQEMLENLSKLGGNYMSSVQRESTIYQASVFNKDVEKMLESIAQTIRYPNFTDQEFEESLLTADYEVSQLCYNSEIYLSEELHSVAYKDNTLGLPLYIPQERIPLVGKTDILQYQKKFFQPQNIVIAMVGVPHDFALKIVNDNFGTWENTTSTRPEKGVVNYTGGEIILPHRQPLYANLTDLYHMQIGFETTGLLNDDLYALATLQKLLGGGSAFSAGGPGKGMFSRLYTQVLNKYSFVDHCMCFNHSYLGTGIFGVTLSIVPEAAHFSSQIISHELSKLLIPDGTSKDAINNRELKRAKNQLISSLLMNVESRLAKLEDLGRQIQCQGKITSIDEMVEKISNITIKDIQNVSEKVLTGNVVTSGTSSGTPSVVMQGEREAFGDVEYILRQYGLGKFSGPEITEPRDFAPKKKKGWF